MMHTLEWKEHAVKEIGHLDKTTVKRIVESVEEMAADLTHHDIKKLRNEDHYRLRVGHYRVIFGLTPTVITVLKVGSRQNIYEQ